VCILDLVIIKYYGNNTIEIKRIVFTYPDLLPSALVVELELIHVYPTVGIHLLWKSCDVRPVSMSSWNRGFCLPLFCSVMRVPLYWYVCMKSCSYSMNNEVLCIGLSKIVVSVMVPYSCWFLRICWAYADWRLFFLSVRSTSMTGLSIYDMLHVLQVSLYTPLLL